MSTRIERIIAVTEAEADAHWAANLQPGDHATYKGGLVSLLRKDGDSWLTVGERGGLATALPADLKPVPPALLTYPGTDKRVLIGDVVRVTAQRHMSGGEACDIVELMTRGMVRIRRRDAFKSQFAIAVTALTLISRKGGQPEPVDDVQPMPDVDADVEPVTPFRTVPAARVEPLTQEPEHVEKVEIAPVVVVDAAEAAAQVETAYTGLQAPIQPAKVVDAMPAMEIAPKATTESANAVWIGVRGEWAPVYEWGGGEKSIPDLIRELTPRERLLTAETALREAIKFIETALMAGSGASTALDANLALSVKHVNKAIEYAAELKGRL